MAPDDWRRDQRGNELWDIIDTVSAVEEIEIAHLKDMCERYDIGTKRFIETWVDLCDAAHEIVDKAEEKLF